MLTVVSKTRIFVSSYIPLYIILFVQYCHFSKNLLKQPLLVTLLSIIILSFFMLILFIKYISSTNNIIKTIEVRNVKKLKESNLTYLLSNIIPLIAFDFTNKQQIISFLIIFFVLLLMYVKYSLITYNPTTELLGYTNYSAELYKNDKKVRDRTILSKCKFIHQNTYNNVKSIELDSDLFFVTKIIED